MATGVQIVFDCADPDTLATFWAAALHYKKQDPPSGFASWPDFLKAQGIPEQEWNSASAIVDPDGAGPRIYFQRVPEGKVVKNRVHLDLNVGGPRDAPHDQRRGDLDPHDELGLVDGHDDQRVGPRELVDGGADAFRQVTVVRLFHEVGDHLGVRVG